MHFRLNLSKNAQNKNYIKIISVTQNTFSIYRPKFWNSGRKMQLLRNPSVYHDRCIMIGHCLDLVRVEFHKRMSSSLRVVRQKAIVETIEIL